MTDKSVNVNSSSQGHSFSNAAQLDRHFIGCQPEYEAMLRHAGIRPGWRVLDAGCGVGSFLPLMSELVGSSGHITAMDVAQENIDIVKYRVSAEPLSFHCPIATDVGNITSLSAADGTYDAVWCSAITQYLSDDQLRETLAGFRRVVRPGGLVIVKDFLTSCWQMQPMEPTLLWRVLIAAEQSGNAYVAQLLRNPLLPKYVREAMFSNVNVSTYVVERHAPVSENDIFLLAGVIGWLIGLGTAADLPIRDIEQLKQAVNPSSAAYIFDNLNYHYIESHLMVIGTV